MQTNFQHTEYKERRIVNIKTVNMTLYKTESRREYLIDTKLRLNMNSIVQVQNYTKTVIQFLTLLLTVLHWYLLHTREHK